MNLRVGLGSMLFVVAACGGKTDTNASDAGVDGGAIDGYAIDAHHRVDGQTSDAALLDPACPAYGTPQAGSPCTDEGIECEYGSDPRWTCNSVATCSNGHWKVPTITDTSCPTPTTNPSSCPPSYASAPQPGACTGLIACQYPEGWCSCILGGGPPVPDGAVEYLWMCGLTLAPSCPASRPRLGTTCTASDLHCSYGPCDTPTGLSVRCSPLTLTWMGIPGYECPGDP